MGNDGECRRHATRLAALVCSFLFSVLALNAQVNSPYSNYGFGDLLPQQYSWSRGMGGISAGLIDGAILNIDNPASYAWINRAMLDLGLQGSVLNLQENNSETTTQSGNGNISHLAIGLPLWKNRIGMSMGLTPYSRVSYLLQQEIIRDTLIGRERLDYEGNGGLYRAHIGVGGRWRNWAIGANASFLFGSQNYARFVSFLDTTAEGAYSTQVIRSERVRDVLFNGGIAHRFDLPNDLQLNVGASGNLKTRVTGSEDIEYVTLLIGATGVAIKDSVSSRGNGAVSADLPAELAIGFTLRQSYRQVDDALWRVGIDYRRAWWTGFTDFRGQTDFTNAWSVRIGGEITPGDRPDNNRRPMDYRLGFRYGSGYLSFDNQPLTEFGMTFGLGIPVSYGYGPQRNSKINLSLEYGQRNSDQFFSETFFRGTLGFTLSDSFWFLRSKIN